MHGSAKAAQWPRMKIYLCKWICENLVIFWPAVVGIWIIKDDAFINRERLIQCWLLQRVWLMHLACYLIDIYIFRVLIHGLSWFGRYKYIGLSREVIRGACKVIAMSAPSTISDYHFSWTRKLRLPIYITLLFETDRHTCWNKLSFLAHCLALISSSVNPTHQNFSKTLH